MMYCRFQQSVSNDQKTIALAVNCLDMDVFILDCFDIRSMDDPNYLFMPTVHAEPNPVQW